MSDVPKGLKAGGTKLWQEISEGHALDAGQEAMLEQACRQRDRTDMLHETIIGSEAVEAGDLRQERDAALAMTRLLAAMRLPDDAGKRPQARQIRGVQEPSRILSIAERAKSFKG